ncbi:MAG: PD-(D/E)XK nuclease family protein [Salinivirgaceae bacterium]|nr:PD-(D/E)XK nuclease family protein [Salinivirgaceae bacterium]
MDNKTIDNKKDWSKEIIDFYNCEEYQKLNEYYNRSTIFEVLGIQRNETRHSKFLKWLLDPTSNHQLGDVPLRKFLRLLSTGIKDEELKTKFLSNKYTISDCIIGTEWNLNQQKDKIGRVDLYISFKIGNNDNDSEVAIVIENKINANEETIPVSKINDEDAKKYFDKIKNETGKIGQTEFYQYCIEKNGEKNNNIFVYLTPDGRDCKSKDYIKITYQNIVDDVIDPILLMNLATETRFFIKEYLRTLSILAANDEENNSEKKTLKTIIATSKSETECLEKLGKDRKELIKEAFKNRDNDDAEGWKEKCLKDFWDRNKTLLASILKVTDNKKYLTITKERCQNQIIIYYNGNKMESYNEFPLKVIEDYVKNEKITDIEALRDKFGTRKKGNTVQMFATEGQFREFQKEKTKNYWSKDYAITLDGGEKIYVTKVWKNIDNTKDEPNHNLRRFIGILEKDSDYIVGGNDNLITITTKKKITE